VAGHGPPPAPTKRRRNQDPIPEQVLVADGTVHGPDLPAGVLPENQDWHPQTVALWESLRRSPLLADEPELGWQFLVDTALMHHTMWAKGRWEFASEVRLRLAKYGATPEDRMRLRIKVATPDQDNKGGSETGVNAASAAARRRNLHVAG
jgi:hypothetical protein